MGMFDYLYCEYPIDAPDGTQFQTKDTDSQYLENYKIDKDGYLWHEYREYMWCVPENASKLSDFCGALKTTKREWRKLEKYRGSIDFYTDIDGEWFEYSAFFKDGKLFDIERV